MFLMIEIGWWFLIVAAFVCSWFLDIPSKIEGVFKHNNSKVATYTNWGVVRITDDPAQQELLRYMYAEEIALKNKAEDNRHAEAKTKLANEAEDAKRDDELEQLRIVRAYRLALFRWGCLSVIVLSGVWKWIAYLDRKDARHDNRLFIQTEAKIRGNES